MLNVRQLGEVISEYPDFEPEWRELEYGGLENPKFGRVEHVAICKETGEPIFDQYVIEETPGSIIVPYGIHNKNFRVGLSTADRFVPGEEFVELPRGFGKPGETELETAYRELFEETGFIPGSVEIIGYTNHNTAFYTTEAPIIAARCNRLEEIQNPGEDSIVEKIKSVKPYTMGDLERLRLEGKLKCGITKSALADFILYAQTLNF